MGASFTAAMDVDAGGPGSILETEGNSSASALSSGIFDIEAPLAVSGGDPSASVTFGRQTIPILEPDIDPLIRQINFNLVGTPDGSEEGALQSAWDGSDVWIVIHGWNDNPDGRFADLAEVVADARPGDIVLTLDWSEAAQSSVPNSSDFLNSLLGLNGRAASWISDVADRAAGQLEDWGIANGSQLNFIGHSLGALVSSQIASEFTKVNTIFALDPPAETNLLLSGGYDLTFGDDEIVRPQRFDRVSDFSRAFLGRASIAGNDEFASWAHESFLLDFGRRVDVGNEHFWVIDTFSQLIEAAPANRTRPGSELADDLFSLDDGAHPEFARDRFQAFTAREPNHEGIIYLDLPPDPESNRSQPQFLNAFVATDAMAPEDNIIYGTNGNDRLADFRLDYSPAFRFRFNSFRSLGDDSGTGNDELIGGAGRDILIGSRGDDILAGGPAADNFVFGGSFIIAAAEPQSESLTQLTFDDIGIDTIADFGLGNDRIVLDATTFTAFEGSARRPLQAEDLAIVAIDSAESAVAIAGASPSRIVFDRASGNLFYNPDAEVPGFSGGGPFAVLSGAIELSANDIYIQA